MTTKTKKSAGTLAELYESAVEINRANRRDEARAVQRKLLPIEDLSSKALSESLGKALDSGNAELDAKYKRLDLAEAVKATRKQRGVPFRVPKFAVFDVNAASCVLQAEQRSMTWGSTSASTPYLDKLYRPILDTMGAKAKSRLFRAEMLTRLGTLSLMVPLAAGAYVLGGILASLNGSGIGSTFFGVVQVLGLALATGVCGLGALACAAATFLGLDLSDSNNVFWGNSTCSLSLALGGALPDKVRDNIRQLQQSRTFEAILIVAEAPDWKYSTSIEFLPERIDQDPLVVGYKDNAYYLVDKFDVVPLENWLASEFTS